MTTSPERVLSLALPPTSAPQVVVISGGPGSGRTTLLRRTVARMERAPVWIDCAVFARSRPLGSLREALVSTSPRLFPGPMAEALRAVLADTPQPATDELGALVWSEIAPGVPALQTQVVVADDFHLLDHTSRRVAGYVLHRVARLGHVPVLVSVEAGVGLDDPFPIIDLGPLSTDEVRLLAEDLIGAPIPYRVAAQLQCATAGNTLAVVDVVRALAPDQLRGRDLLPHPLPLGQAAARRLLRPDGLQPASCGLLLGLAIQHQLGMEPARRLAGSQDALEEALAHGVVEQGRSGIEAADPVRALAAGELATAAQRRTVH